MYEKSTLSCKVISDCFCVGGEMEKNDSPPSKARKILAIIVRASLRQLREASGGKN